MKFVTPPPPPQGKPILICGESDEDIPKKSQNVLKVPEIVDCLQGILSVIPLQLLSFHIAVLRGFNVCELCVLRGFKL